MYGKNINVFEEETCSTKMGVFREKSDITKVGVSPPNQQGGRKKVTHIVPKRCDDTLIFTHVYRWEVFHFNGHDKNQQSFKNLGR